MPIIPRSKPLRFALAGVSLLLLVVGWFLVSPLFIDETVDEEFPTSMADESLPDRVMDEAMPGGPVRVATGQFVDADAVHKGEGSATLYTLEGGQNVIRFEDFRVTNGPDLYVWLSDAAPGATSEDVRTGRSIELGELKGNVGNQNYELPADVDPGEYRSVVIWCRAFGVLFSQAVLEGA